VRDLLLNGRDFINSADEGVTLNIPKMIKADQDVTVRLTFGEGTAMPASTTFYAAEVVLEGTELNDKDAN